MGGGKGGREEGGEISVDKGSREIIEWRVEGETWFAQVS